MPHRPSARATASEADAWREKARERSIAGADALAQLAACYRTGRGGVALNPRRAAELYKESAERGSAEGACVYGTLLMTGVPGVGQSFVEGRRWLEKAAGTDQHLAIYKLGCMHLNGDGGEADVTKARELFERAMELGSVGATIALSSMYRDGLGVERDQQEADRLLSKAEAARSEKARGEQERARDGHGVTGCSLCGKGPPYREQLKLCAKCRGAKYCSRECQTAHWKAGHKEQCKLQDANSVPQEPGQGIKHSEW
eukprot:jgi/Tetstr1/464925/TSEL_009659.t1